MTPNYQLTKHPVGSIREIWAISWPLMLGLISGSLMIFMDRLLLSWYSPMALNAGANAGMAYYLFLVIPMSICAISEVLVGRLHGEGKHSEVGKPVWQMVWFAWMVAPIFLLIAFLAPKFIFYNTGNEVNETAYFQPLIIFSPFMCSAIALSGFFIGIGKVKVVTFCTVLANVMNAILGYVLIFGMGPIPSFGVLGAGIAMGIAQMFQNFLLLMFFLNKRNREVYGTNNLAYHSSYFKDGLRIGVPSGSGHAIEVLAHYVFFRIVMMSGQEQMTVVAIVQSIYMLASFVIDSVSKGVSAIIANLIGALEFGFISKVLKAATKLHFVFFALLASSLVLFPNMLLNLFFSHEGSELLRNPQFIEIAFQAGLWMTLFFLFDGFSWIMVGHLTAAGDTKFIFYVSSVVNWIAYVLPTFILVGVNKNGANVAWMIIALYSMVNFFIYFWRYRSGKWLAALPKREQPVTVTAAN